MKDGEKIKCQNYHKRKGVAFKKGSLRVKSNLNIKRKYWESLVLQNNYDCDFGGQKELLLFHFIINKCHTYRHKKNHHYLNIIIIK